MNRPLISVVTITFNSEKYLEQTIKSVIRQTYDNREYIIIDGASKDSTIEIIKKYAGYIDFWKSEPDSGIADAMNKALKIANGDFILFIHSDDYLLDEEILDKAVNYLDPEHDIFLFNLFYSLNNHKTLAKPRGLNWWINVKTGVLHQGCICSRALFAKIGDFNENFKIAMDYDFFLRAYRANVMTKYIDMPITVMRQTGISARADWNNLKKRLKEEQDVHFKNCNNSLLKYLYMVYWIFYPPYKYILTQLLKK